MPIQCFPEPYGAGKPSTHSAASETQAHGGWDLPKSIHMFGVAKAQQASNQGHPCRNFHLPAPSVSHSQGHGCLREGKSPAAGTTGEIPRASCPVHPSVRGDSACRACTEGTGDSRSGTVFSSEKPFPRRLCGPPSIVYAHPRGQDHREGPFPQKKGISAPQASSQKATASFHKL